MACEETNLFKYTVHEGDSYEFLRRHIIQYSWNEQLKILKSSICLRIRSLKELHSLLKYRSCELSESLVGWLCTVACYDSIVVTSEGTGTISATTTCQQLAGQPAKEKQRIGHTTPGMYVMSINSLKSYEDEK